MAENGFSTGIMPKDEEAPMSLMSEDADPSASHAAARSAAASSVPNRGTFNRLELNRILNLYGRMVADGEWRVNAVDVLTNRAAVSVVRGVSEVPPYRMR